MNILDLSFKASFWVQLIMLILIVLSIASWTIILQRSKFLNIATRETKIFEDHFRSGVELSLLYKECQVRCDILNGLEQIFYSGFKEFVRLGQVNCYALEVVTNCTSRVMRISMNRELESLEVYISFLGTVGSICPYIGLFGTVCGIIHSFIALGSVRQATLQIIAPGISEALIVTAIGLFVAIPAVIAYNRLNHQLNKLEQSYDNFIEEFLAILHRQAFISEKQ